jgi:glycosyltransferase involved in cell wall biosynthesis
LRIWLVNHYAVPPNIAGITRHFELAKEWAGEEDTQVTIWASSFTHPRRQFISKEEKDAIDLADGMDVKWIWSFPHKKNDFKRIINMLSFCILFFFKALFAKRPDVIVASSPHIFTGFFAWMVAAIRGIPLVFEVRDLWPDTLIKMGGLKNPTAVRFLTWMENLLYRKAERIIVLTEYQRKFIINRGFPAEKIRLIPNGVVVKSWSPNPAERDTYKRKMGIPVDDFIAIYTGAHGPANALHHVVKAGKYLDDKKTHIVLIGDGPEKEKLIKLKQEKGIENVHFLDPVPKSEIFNYTYAADCGIISLSDNEIFRGARPNKLFDYSFVGKPIITMVDGELREIVEENDLGIFSEPENPKALAESIKKVKKFSAEKLKQIAKNGRDYIDREGDRKKLAHKYHGILKEMLKERELKKTANSAG